MIEGKYLVPYEVRKEVETERRNLLFVEPRSHVSSLLSSRPSFISETWDRT